MRRRREEPVGGVNLGAIVTPFLDMSFQILAFFIMTYHPSAFEAHDPGSLVPPDQFDDAIALPVATAAVPIDNTAEEWIFLNLDVNGKLAGALSNAQLDTPQKIKVHLVQQKEGLERAARTRGKTGEVKVVVILRADRNCRYRDVWQVLDSCQQAGFKHWQLRVMTQAGKA